jgi:hypothetical protein
MPVAGHAHAHSEGAKGASRAHVPLYTPEAFSLRAGPVRWTGVMKTDGTGV